MDNRIASDQIVPERETLTVAFQQDFEDIASDGALIETVVGMANAEGGTLYIGVGEEGRIFGVRTEAGNNPEKAVAFIASHTVPPLIVSAESEEVEGKKIWVVRVPKAEGIVAAQDGKVLKRRLGVGKKPGTFPLYPPEFVSRLSDIGRLDFSAMILSGTSTDDLDDLKREGLRAFMRKNRAEKGLADLEDSEFDKALGFVRETRSGILPTVAGLLMIGKVTVIQRRLSGAGIMFQHFSGSVVRSSQEFVMPLVSGFEAVLDRFRARNEESEWMDGFVRVGVPTYSERAFREALVNALCHRDYARQGSVAVSMLDDGLEIASPGGFVSGITPENLPTSESRPRNPLLADIFRRIGLADCRGRGIERILEGNLAYGRPAPDYTESNEECVRIVFPKCDADREFQRFLIRSQQRLGEKIVFPELLILSAVRFAGSLTLAGPLEATHLSEQRLVRYLKSLAEKEMLEGVGRGNDREWMLRGLCGRKVGSVSFPETGRKEAWTLRLVRANATVTRGDVMAHLGLDAQAAYRLLKRLVDRGLLVREGSKRGSVYRTPE